MALQNKRSHFSAKKKRPSPPPPPPPPPPPVTQVALTSRLLISAFIQSSGRNGIRIPKALQEKRPTEGTQKRPFFIILLSANFILYIFKSLRKSRGNRNGGGINDWALLITLQKTFFLSEYSYFSNSARFGWKHATWVSLKWHNIPHGIKGFVIQTESIVKIGITKIFCYNKSSIINKTFGCCSKIFGCSNTKFICCP